MAILIVELTDTQIADKKAKLPASDPKRFEVQEKTALGIYTLDYCDTKEEAEKVVKQWAARDDLIDDIGDFVGRMVEKYSDLLEEKEIKQVIREY